MFEKFKQLLFEVDSMLNSTTTNGVTTTISTSNTKLNDFTNHHHLNNLDIDLANTNMNDQKKSSSLNNNVNSSQLKNENDHINNNNKNSKTMLIDDTNHKS
jgi:hypothetical protein